MSAWELIGRLLGRTPVIMNHRQKYKMMTWPNQEVKQVLRRAAVETAPYSQVSTLNDFSHLKEPKKNNIKICKKLILIRHIWILL